MTRTGVLVLGVWSWLPLTDLLGTSAADEPTGPQVRVKERLTFWGHPGLAPINSICFSPDGKTLASAAGKDNTVKLWNVATGEEKATLKGHPGNRVGAVAFSPDGKLLASGSGKAARSGEIKLWDVQSGQERATLEGHKSTVLSLCFSPDGKTLASGSGYGTIQLWNVETGKEQASLKGHGVTRSLAFSPDGKTLAASGGYFDVKEAQVTLYDVVTGAEKTAFKEDTDIVWCVCFSPDGKTLACAADRSISLWNTATGQRETSLRHGRAVRCVCFSPDGKTLASAGLNGQFVLWDVATGKELARIEDFQGGVRSISFSPDGKTLATTAGGSIILWDVGTPK
jgi:WD40 repeat protein